jgi:[acyl-carrier-protein] S-malonyltransferase
MQKTAFLFPGQGSQSLGMMSDLSMHSGEVRRTFEEAGEVLGFDLWKICQDGPAEDLNRTEITQPALLTAGVATWRAWRSDGGLLPDFVAGHSLGEYSALVAAGVLGFADAVALAAERGRAMQEATPAGTAVMAAVLGLDDESLADICEKASQGQVVSCANFNSPGQVVIAGEKDAVERAIELAKQAGARRALPLPVSVASHCELMRPAAETIARSLSNIDIGAPEIPVIHNVDVKAHDDPEQIRGILVEQMVGPVRWSETIEWLAAQGARRFAECGPGKVLAGLNRRIDRDLETVALESWDALQQTRENWS